jgi:gluconolactonase
MFYKALPIRETMHVYTTLPEPFRIAKPTQWAKANKAGALIHSFLEGPVFDAKGNLYVTDIPHGRIFRISPNKNWELVLDYDGEPNGMNFLNETTLLITDYKNGLMSLNLETSTLEPFLARRNTESFKGVNDLCIAKNGDIYFTDQGQTGLQDPTGRVYRYAQGKLDCLLNNAPSPNGLVLNAAENVLFVAMTRDNSVWRVPLLLDGGVAKVGRFCTLFGVSGPDGLAMVDNHLYVAHPSLAGIFVFNPRGELTQVFESPTGISTTNLCVHNGSLYVTESETGTILTSSL